MAQGRNADFVRVESLELETAACWAEERWKGQELHPLAEGRSAAAAARVERPERETVAFWLEKRWRGEGLHVLA